MNVTLGKVLTFNQNREIGLNKRLPVILLKKKKKETYVKQIQNGEV
jgi:hypothetical protein